MNENNTPVAEEAAIAFAEWIVKEGIRPLQLSNNWYKPIAEKQNIYFETKELYQKYFQSLIKKESNDERQTAQLQPVQNTVVRDKDGKRINCYGYRGGSCELDLKTGKCECDTQLESEAADEKELLDELNFVSDIVRNKYFDLGFRTGYVTAQAKNQAAPVKAEVGEDEDLLWKHVAKRIPLDIAELEQQFIIKRRQQ